MPSLNKIQVMGHLGKDPDTKFLQDGTAVTNFSVAATEKWKDKNSGERKEKTEWFNVQAWRKLAEICGQYLYKGALVFVEGKLQTRDWTDRDGVKRYTTEVIASEVKFLSKREKPATNYERDPGPPLPTPDDDIPY